MSGPAPLVVTGMEHRFIGNSGLRVSALGLGCMGFGGRSSLRETQAITHRALDLGITLFDTADVYGNRGDSERWLGRALGPRRRDVVIATKFGGSMSPLDPGMSGAAPARIVAAAEASLRRLNTDYIDLYQLHKPDPLTPLEDTLAALDGLVRQGKVRFIGCCKLPPTDLERASSIALSRGAASFVSTQNHYNVITRSMERSVVPAARRLGIGVLPYFPLERGLLTASFRPGTPLPAGSRAARWLGVAPDADRMLDAVDRLSGICRRHGTALLTLAIQWLLREGAVASVIAGASSVGQVEQNVAACGTAVTAEALREADAVLPA